MVRYGGTARGRIVVASSSRPGRTLETLDSARREAFERGDCFACSRRYAGAPSLEAFALGPGLYTLISYRAFVIIIELIPCHVVCTLVVRERRKTTHGR